MTSAFAEASLKTFSSQLNFRAAIWHKFPKTPVFFRRSGAAKEEFKY